MQDHRFTGESFSDRSRCPGYGRGEPPVAELLRDPIIRLVMARDRIHHDDVRRLMSRMRARLNARNVAIEA